MFFINLKIFCLLHQNAKVLTSGKLEVSLEVIKSSDKSAMKLQTVLLKGDVKKLHNINIGWNELEMNGKKNQILFNQKFFYFIHSFYIDSSTDYAHSYSFLDDFKFCSSIHYKNTLATQFHLEKSGKCGLDIIEGFYNGCI